MTERFRELERLYDEALRVPRENRPAFLDQACSGDPDLRSELSSLLDYDEKVGNLLSSSALDVAARIVARSKPGELGGSRIRQYEIVSLPGSGGMGEVYLARDTMLQRKVALKVLRPEAAVDPARVARLLSEARAASALSHPNIATVYEVVRFASLHLPFSRCDTMISLRS
jgi:serine/threonine-protein kinase